jgi:hypothetical protein
MIHSFDEESELEDYDKKPFNRRPKYREEEEEE